MRGGVRAALVAVVAAGLTLSGCATEAPRTGLTDLEAPERTYTAPPLPPGATELPSPTAPPPEPECDDPTASLAPYPVGSRPTEPTPAVDRIRARGRLVVGLDTGSNLMSFRDPATGTVQGFDVDIAREIARDIVGSPDRIEYRQLTSADRIKALQTEAVDVVVKTMSITCERRKSVEFSAEYFDASQRILVPIGSDVRSYDDLAGRRVCVAKGTTSLARIQELVPDATVLAVPMWSDCLVALQQHQADAISSDDTILAGLATQDPYVTIVGASLGSEPYGVGIPLQSPDLVRTVNGTLERIRADGTWAELYERWLGVLGAAPTPPAPVYRDAGR
ncbi:glutamate ABC transporter substrate-binding protein [Rhodococcus sp. HNM0569]|uniref:glutamate ABC transporter substrate-binding protein n=1 Tax=Rhodococcus sp. HNM0569 TaxID=2716340 RepID=UPI003211D21A